MGGWSEKLSGFWFAKFEMSETSDGKLQSIYGVESVRGQTIGTQYTNARTATYGYNGTIDTFDNRKSYMNSHMVKNSEWGAVAYLTHSKYGRNGQEVIINNVGFGTGGAFGEVYKTNTNQSTTGSVYGVYDMSGGSWEHVAVYNSIDSANVYSKVGWKEATGLTIESSSTKYATKYKNETITNVGNKTVYEAGKTGDAIKEVNTGGIYIKEGTGKYCPNWFSDNLAFAFSSIPLSSRGGYYLDAHEAGIFFTGNTYGLADRNVSFRVALCSNN